MIKTNYKNFLLEKFAGDFLRYYCFDWDDNILLMPTVIHVEHLVDGNWKNVDLSTAEFAEIRTEILNYSKGEESKWRLKNNSHDETYCEFRDFGPRGNYAFIEDTKKAIENDNFGPVWNDFLQCMVDGHIFMIITARGHEPQTIKFAVSWIIFNQMTNEQRESMERNLRNFNQLFGVDDKGWYFEKLVDYYLNICDFIGITSNYFKKKYNTEGQVVSPEKFKSMAIKEFTEKVTEFGKMVNKKVKLGFSDDDILTVQHVHKYIRDELSLDFPIDYHVYHTKDGIVKL